MIEESRQQGIPAARSSAPRHVGDHGKGGMKQLFMALALVLGAAAAEAVQPLHCNLLQPSSVRLDKRKP